MLPPRLPRTLELAAESQYRAALVGEPADAVALGLRVLDHISPPNWTLEWSLPGWLGDVCGLAAPAVAELTLANVLGLAYIKLQDDLSDDEIGEDDQRAARLLSTVIHRKWLQVYAGLFPDGSPFWGHFEQSMAQWEDAAWRSRQEQPKPFADWGEEDFLILGHRGAPLKICAAGACLLAGQDVLLARFESALDHLLIGAVLLDHVMDWADDLAVGRYNAFVAYASAWPQTAEQREANRRAVREELLVGRAGRPYFRLLRRQLAAAQAMARQLACEDLVRYLSWLRSETITYGEGMAAAARNQLHRALEPLFVAAEIHAGV